MQFALLNDKRIKATKSGELGACPCCRNEVRAHCGELMIWHWKHIQSEECDNWYEKETQWHIDWKNQFPIDCQEVICFDKRNGEKHIADIKTKHNDVVIEFQNSPLTINELISRENFYKNVIWVINGRNFVEQIELFELSSKKSPLIFPRSGELLRKIGTGQEIFKIDEIDTLSTKQKDCMNHINYINLLKSSFKNLDRILETKYSNHSGYNSFKTFIENEKLRYSKQFSEMNAEKDKLINYINDLANKRSKEYYNFIWKRRKEVWFKTQSYKFIDFGDSNLYRIIDSDLIKRVPKNDFIEKYNNYCI